MSTELLIFDDEKKEERTITIHHSSGAAIEQGLATTPNILDLFYIKISEDLQSKEFAVPGLSEDKNYHVFLTATIVETKKEVAESEED